MPRDLGLLLLRLSCGLLLLVAHGWGKAVRIASGQLSFADPLGLGPVPSLLLVTFAELVCALAVVVGFRVRWAAIPPAIAMLVAAFVYHAGDPLGDRELALLYAGAFLALACTGGGRYSLDSWWRERRGRRSRRR